MKVFGFVKVLPGIIHRQIIGSFGTLKWPLECIVLKQDSEWALFFFFSFLTFIIIFNFSLSAWDVDEDS